MMKYSVILVCLSFFLLLGTPYSFPLRRIGYLSNEPSATHEIGNDNNSAVEYISDIAEQESDLEESVKLDQEQLDDEKEKGIKQKANLKPQMKLRRSSGLRRLIIRIGTRGIAILRLNGRIIMRTSLFNGMKKKILLVRPGDVISVEGDKLGIRNYWLYGIFVDIKFNGRRDITGISKNFKVKAFHPKSTSAHRSWFRKSFSSCKWPAATPLMRRLSHRKVLRSGYVWDGRESLTGIMRRKSGRAVVLRFVVGGEKCKPRVLRHCLCREIPNEHGNCYEMRRKNHRRGLCWARKCESKYVCVPGAQELPDCVRRLAKYKVIRVANLHGRKHCKRVRIDPPTPYWIRY